MWECFLMKTGSSWVFTALPPYLWSPFQILPIHHFCLLVWLCWPSYTSWIQFPVPSLQSLFPLPKTLTPQVAMWHTFSLFSNECSSVTILPFIDCLSSALYTPILINSLLHIESSYIYLFYSWFSSRLKCKIHEQKDLVQFKNTDT